MKEPGIYVALEEHPVQVRINMRGFGWDVRQYEQENKFAVVDAFTAGIGEVAKREKYVVKDPDSVEELVDVLKTAVSDIGAERVVDSVSTLYLTRPSVARSVVLQLKKVYQV
jgi:KaiC/GvpD/RAD55 family RecA-like ATPase